MAVHGSEALFAVLVLVVELLLGRSYRIICHLLSLPSGLVAWKSVDCARRLAGDFAYCTLQLIDEVSARNFRRFDHEDVAVERYLAAVAILDESLVGPLLQARHRDRYEPSPVWDPFLGAAASCR